MGREEELHQFLPVSESRSSVRSGLAVKDSLRFIEDLALPSFTSNSLRSSFGVLVNGDNLSLFCREENENTKSVSMLLISCHRHVTDEQAEV